MKILVLGATGMLGHTLYRLFSATAGLTAFGSIRNERSLALFDQKLRGNLIAGVDAADINSLIGIFAETAPDVVVNCVGVIKQLKSAKDPLYTIPINALLPHTLARLCQAAGARLIHLSTDCVFRGDKGMYLESDPPDATDLYGRSKLLGEVDYANAITLRTSIIGHELGESKNGLVEWFLSQQGSAKGYTQAVFSGFPTVEIGNVIVNYVLPDTGLHGLYHVASQPINKHDLLQLVARIYGKEITLSEDDTLRINRSLDASRFNAATGYTPPTWVELVMRMKEFGR